MNEWVLSIKLQWSTYSSPISQRQIMLHIENVSMKCSIGRERETQSNFVLFLSQSITKHTNDKLLDRSPFPFNLNHCLQEREFLQRGTSRHALNALPCHKFDTWMSVVAECGDLMKSCSNEFKHFIAHIYATIYAERKKFTCWMEVGKAIFFDCKSKSINFGEENRMGEKIGGNSFLFLEILNFFSTKKCPSLSNEKQHCSG